MDWLKDCFKNLGNWILSVADKIIGFFDSIYDDVVDFFTYIIESIGKILSWFESVFHSFTGKVADWFADFADLIPDLQSYYTTFFDNYGKSIYICNQWVNLSLAINLFFIYLSLWLVFVTIKFTLKLIPTIG